MATLEKIRSKSVLLLIIIGAALIAFIIGDFFTSGRTLFGTGTTVAQVGSQKIDIREYQNRLEAASQQAQQSGRKVDSAVLQQQVLDQLIAEALFKEEVEKLGLKVTDQELSQTMVGDNSAQLDQVVNSQFGVPTARELHEMAYNPSKYSLSDQQAQQLRAYWMDLENQVEQTLLQQKFQNLFAGTLVANKLDAKALYDDNNNTANIAFAKKDLASVPDAEVGEVSDDEINARYSQEKNRFRIDEPTRRISFINVPIVPSADDRNAAQARVEAAIAALQSEPEVLGLAEMTDFVVSRQSSAAGRVKDSRVKAFLQEAADSAVKVVSSTGDAYTIAKLIGRSNAVDSVSIDFLAVAGTKAERDSMLALLNAGTPFEELASNPAVQSSQKDMWLSLVDPQLAQMRDMILEAAPGTYFTPDTVADAAGGRIMRINERKAPVTIYDYAVITYTVDPSAATINKAYADLGKFLADNPSAALFNEKAEEAQYMLQHANVTPSTPQVGGISNSRGAVSWAMKAKKGQVSGVLGGEDEGHLMAVALDDIYSGNFAPATDPQIREMLVRDIINDKKAEKLMQQYAGKASDIAGYAKVMETQPDSTNVTMGQFMVPKFGMNESALQAAATVAAPGKLVGPMKAGQSVVVFQVVSNSNDGRPFSLEESSAQFARMRATGPLGQQLDKILRGTKKVKNNILKFYNDNPNN